VEVKIKSLEEPREALEAGADIVMLDELSLEDMREAVRLTAGRAKLEASGGISDSTLRVIAETGVNDDFIGTNRGLSLVFRARTASSAMPSDVGRVKPAERGAHRFHGWRWAYP